MSARANMFRRTLLLGSLCCCVPLLRAQTPLVPDWTHVWPFGQAGDVMWVWQPAWKDNHVAVDATNGQVHVSISDEMASVSPRADLLFTFTGTGEEITPTPTPLLNPVSGAEYDELIDIPYNLLGTWDLTAHGGRVSAAHNVLLGANRAHWFSGQSTNGTRWNATHGWFHPVAPLFMHVASDANDVFMASGDMLPWDGSPVFSGFPSSVMCYTQDGRMRWMAGLTSLPWDLVLSDGIVHVLTGLVFGPAVERFSMADGTSLPIISLGLGAQRIAIHNGQIFSATEGTSITLRRHAANGTVQWTTSFPMEADAVLTGMVVDDLGRVWASASRSGPDQTTFTGGRLVGADASGVALGTWAYGASINSMATNGGDLFLTGAVSSLGDDTYLIAKSIALITGEEDLPTEPRPIIWPLPAHEVVHVAMEGGSILLAIEDAMGRRVAEQDARQVAGQVTLDVSSIAPGHYVLRSLDPVRPWAAPFIIAR